LKARYRVPREESEGSGKSNQGQT